MDFPRPTKTYHKTPQPICDPTLPANSAKGKTVVVTGGGRGIGAAISEAFAKAGASTVVLTGRTTASLDQTKSRLASAYPSTTFETHAADITDAAAVDRVFADVGKRNGKIDVCVANAGYLPDAAPVKDADLAEFWRGFEINVKGTVIVAQAFLRNAADSGASFLSVNSGAAHVGPFGPMASYAGSKVAVAKVVEYLQAENPGVKAFSFSPGFIQTEMSAKGGVPDAMFEDVNNPASFAVWLASPQSDFLKGRYLWANWDVEELISMKEAIAKDPSLLTISLGGSPFSK